ncbi:MAG: Methionine ABC transporter ATP-binding protein [Candidatus Ozemobacter sibiricus]|jgi:ABC-type multidrug transport system fused ATPase/permease subunit|uniref:Methionine ABC transporter ATP-binding protein n=1 Tax=Candidatus Ozemobacter sibiricus TaxID=2268124 RepID=A0A367ZJ45_9BACT|nr:MAG: Methionine ABC transporter ATP-binding protein [Candidatus Ozemobacter sibiricus]
MRPPVDEHELRHPRRYYLLWIWRQYRPYRRMILALVGLTVISTVVSVLFPMVFQRVIDGVVTGLKGFKDGTMTLAQAEADRDRRLWYLAALALGPLFAGFYTWLRLRMNLTFEMAFRERYFREVLEKGHRFFLKFRTGDLVTRLTEDVKTWPPGLSWLCCSGIFRAFNSSCIIFFCLVSMFWLSPLLAVVAVVPMPFMVWLFLRMEKAIERRFKRLQTCVSATNDFLESAYSGIKIIKSFNAEEPQIALFGKLLDERIEREVDVARIEGLYHVYFEFLNYLSGVLVMLVGGIMAIRGDITLGVYYAFFSYLGIIMHPLIDIPVLLFTLAQTFVTIDRLEEIVQTEREWQEADRRGDVLIDRIDRIEFRGVEFAHRPLASADAPAPSIGGGATAALSTTATAPPAAGPGASAGGPASQTGEGAGAGRGFRFQPLSFTIRRGEKLAVVGPIGSGKTTLLNLAAGLLTPDAGEILVNGLALRDLRKDRFKEKIGFIQQEPTIFSASVADNIDFWRGYDRDWIETCARLAQFEAEVRALPHQFDEKIGPRGLNLSGGQRQRLAIARALAGRPEVLFMDDVTSALDAENEAQLWQDLRARFPDVTCLIVTHRLSTAQNADRIMVLADGRLEAIGTHDELLRTNATYQKLVS